MSFELEAPEILDEAIADSPPRLHTSEVEPADSPARESRRSTDPEVDRASGHEYEARVAAVADAWSGAVPPVESRGIPAGEARAIDEVNVALGRFSEEAETLPELGSTVRESAAVPPVGPAPSSPWPSNDLAPDGVPSEPVGHAEGAESAPGDPNHASTESDEHTEENRWSLSRIARGLTGH